jgi:hypothetical protein
MKSLRFTLSLCLLLAATVALAQTDAQKSFDHLKTLAGSWEGKNHEGKPLRVVFRDTAGGSALVSEIEGEGHEGHEDMVSMFHLDGPNRLLITHYCSAGNQPRMLASSSPDGKTFTFEFLDATNLATPDTGHMKRVVITIVDASHHTEDWIFAAPGKEMKESFDLHRM